MGYFNFAFDETSDSDFSVNRVSVGQDNCSVTFVDSYTDRLVECPFTWASVAGPSALKPISISLTIPLGSVVTVRPLQDRPPLLPIEEPLHTVSLQVPTDPIPMVSGSHLFGRLTWTRRETQSRWVLGIPTASKPVFVAEITGLQTYPLDSTTASTNDATLVLYQPYSFATVLQQDSSDVTPLSGLATFGGFWTFVNGAFALFFGANVVYFAFGRRPLSALGLIHIFQRRALVRQWHADFPALRTEGGQPGSRSAGIVAFIRERLIDIDQDTRVTTSYDLEAQHSNSTFNSEEDLVGPSTKATESQDYGYGLEDIPLIHPDLGFTEILSQKGLKAQ
ncbi:hypothetical protein K438DRAFT_1859514 [Mycena galopus ATCC 62051]|nr:hypothetical protein K438DRAFT_1859514 [Mycena galopus ATCC 62051]